MDKYYLHERRHGGQVSTVGIYYSLAEAEDVIARLRELPGKQACEYVLTRPGEPAPRPPR